MKERGRLFVLSGFSGSGKGTIVKTLLRDHDNYILSVSMTTRAPRDEDREGVTYFFVTKEQFEERIAAGAMMEYARYGDNYYGTPQSFVEEKLAEGYDVVVQNNMRTLFENDLRRPWVVEEYRDSVSSRFAGLA